MDLTPFVPLIGVAVAGAYLALNACYKHKLARRRKRHDIELEVSALPALDKLCDSRLTSGEKYTELRLMLAWGDLPSYVTPADLQWGVEAVIKLIEQTSYERSQEATERVDEPELTLVS